MVTGLFMILLLLRGVSIFGEILSRFLFWMDVVTPVRLLLLRLLLWIASSVLIGIEVSYRCHCFDGILRQCECHSSNNDR